MDPFIYRLKNYVEEKTVLTSYSVFTIKKQHLVTTFSVGIIMNSGCYTAITTPYKNGAVDYEGLEKLVAFQIQNGITGILAVGTTGESPVLNWDEHNKVIEAVANKTKNQVPLHCRHRQ